MASGTIYSPDRLLNNRINVSDANDAPFGISFCHSDNTPHAPFYGDNLWITLLTLGSVGGLTSRIQFGISHWGSKIGYRTFNENADSGWKYITFS